MTPLRHMTAALMAAGVVSPVFAQTVAPDAGRLSRELQPPVQPPLTAPTLILPSPGKDTVKPGGPQVTVNQIRFSGNTVLQPDDLANFVKPALGKQYDLAGLYGLAEQVSQFYREQGYGFAKVFVGEGAYNNGVLTFEVIEGQYGQTKVISEDPELREQTPKFLARLTQGKPIYTPELERQILILDDLPGVDVAPVMRPGALPGQGDLDVTVNPTPKVSGNVGLSNHGNRYTGYWQARANVLVNGLLQFGDQLAVSGLQSDKDLQYGAVNYSMPVGASGLRAIAGYSLTDYTLGREFSNLQASGEAEILSLGASYPFIRSRALNLTGSLVYQDKEFFDEQRAVNTQVARSSDVTSVILNFDRSDPLGVVYGQVDYTVGTFKGPVPDVARTNGNFTRVNYDLARLHVFTNRLSALARINGQVTQDNLDSSESFTLGGPSGVRAYPTGEATGDAGHVVQLELRYRYTDRFTPFVFYDEGQVKFERNPTVAGSNSRGVSGYGVGLRYQEGPLSLEVLAADRIKGGAAQTDPRNDSVRFWFTMRYAF